jgi:hypothetical protein
VKPLVAATVLNLIDALIVSIYWIVASRYELEHTHSHGPASGLGALVLPAVLLLFAVGPRWILVFLDGLLRQLIARNRPSGRSVLGTMRIVFAVLEILAIIPFALYAARDPAEPERPSLPSVYPFAEAVVEVLVVIWTVRALRGGDDDPAGDAVTPGVHLVAPPPGATPPRKSGCTIALTVVATLGVLGLMFFGCLAWAVQMGIIGLH